MEVADGGTVSFGKVVDDEGRRGRKGELFGPGASQHSRLAVTSSVDVGPGSNRIGIPAAEMPQLPELFGY